LATKKETLDPLIGLRLYTQMITKANYQDGRLGISDVTNKFKGRLLRAQWHIATSLAVDHIALWRRTVRSGR